MFLQSIQEKKVHVKSTDQILADTFGEIKRKKDNGQPYLQMLQDFADTWGLSLVQAITQFNRHCGQ